jgi:CheY-like chemotaxis protein
MQNKRGVRLSDLASVMLVDLDLGGGDGLDLIERLHDTFPEVAIVAVGDGMSRRRELTHLKARGAAAVLSKPITPEWKTLVEQLPAMGRRK